jgi:hypothetical protein
MSVFASFTALLEHIVATVALVHIVAMTWGHIVTMTLDTIIVSEATIIVASYTIVEFVIPLIAW